MTVVDVEHLVYKCPHCDGYIIVREQFPADRNPGCSISLIHSDKIPHYEGSSEDLEELEETY